MSYECPHHKLVLDDVACPQCMKDFNSRKPPFQLTKEEIKAEIDRWTGILTIDLDCIYQRLKELMGRSVYTHEMASPETLKAEIDRGEPAYIVEILDKLPRDKLVVTTRR